MKREFRFALVDAFSTRPLGGNPCSVVFDADSLTTQEMQAITREMNQSETAFVLQSKNFDIKARYFTPEREIPLAGHPTIAMIHAAIENGVLSNEKTEIQLELNEGPIKIEIQKSSYGNLIRMFQRKPIFAEVHDPDVVLPIFGLTKSDLLPNSVIQTVSTGTRQLMIAVKSHESLKKLSMNVSLYREYREKMNFFSPHIFCLGGIHSDAQTFARHPGVPPDTLEDAFTGSGTGGMAAFLWKYQFLKKSSFTAEQGHWMERPGRAFVEVIGSPENIESVIVAGPAVTVVKGQLVL